LQLQRYKKKLIFKIKNTFDHLRKENSTEFEKYSYAKVVAGLRRMASSRHTKTATPTSPAKPPKEERAATTALVSREETGPGRGPVAFWIYAFITNFINKILFP
jgi:hypothetical protein